MVPSVCMTLGNCPKMAKLASTRRAEVEARKLTEPIKLPARIASKGVSWRAALATQRRRCRLMITDSDG